MADASGPDPSPPASGDPPGADALTDAQKSLRALDFPVGVAVATGVTIGTAALVATMRWGYHLYLRVWREHTPLRPTPPAS